MFLLSHDASIEHVKRQYNAYAHVDAHISYKHHLNTVSFNVSTYIFITDILLESNFFFSLRKHVAASRVCK
jgi:hypothetical protein